MKRLNLTIILTIVLVLSFSTASFASAVGGAGGAIGVIEGVSYDPRTDSRYAEYFDYSNDDVSGLNYYGDVVIQYKYEDDDGIFLMKKYVRMYSDAERLGVVLDSSVSPEHCYIYLSQGTKYKVSIAREMFDGTFDCNKTQGEPNVSLYGGNLELVQDRHIYDIEVVESDMLVFANDDDLVYYLNTGEVRNALYDPSENKNPTINNISSAQIYLDDFQAIYHDAPKLDDCYIEFKYSIPRHLRNVKGNLYIDLFDKYNYNAEFLVVQRPTLEFFGRSLINVSENPYGFSIPIMDFMSIKQCFDDETGLLTSVIKRHILGNELGIDFDKFTFCGIGLNNIHKITKSQLFLDIQLRLGSKTLGKNGTKYSSFVDFLDLSNCYYESSKYDEPTDTYTPNNDAVKDGYYSTDSNGNYNYHSPTGDTTTITNYEYNNSTNSTQYITNNYYGNGDSGNNWINPSDYDWSNPTDLLSAMKKGISFVTDLTKGGVGKGLLSMTKSFYNLLPSDFRDIIVFGIVVVVILGIISIILKVVF